LAPLRPRSGRPHQPPSPTGCRSGPTDCSAPAQTSVPPDPPRTAHPPPRPAHPTQMNRARPRRGLAPTGPAAPRRLSRRLRADWARREATRPYASLRIGRNPPRAVGHSEIHVTANRARATKPKRPPANPPGNTKRQGPHLESRWGPCPRQQRPRYRPSARHFFRPSMMAFSVADGRMAAYTFSSDGR
jgi:hypothetical protein